ncbi:periphilin-1 [Melanotaenia boesemani]|uniref:periphilin-1 n=1 Tax=Melanotaenia boesemani TaxID=1250792 RepID=UPI001C04AF32|nr:periphilin-1 [Melanotaenia boesemani]
MDHARAKDTQESKGLVIPRYREHCDQSLDDRPIDCTASPSKNEMRPFRRVRSPSRPRAWLSGSYKPKFGVRVLKPGFSREDDSFHKANFNTQRYHYLKSRYYVHRSNHLPPKPHHTVLREKERKREKEREKKDRYEERESTDGRSPTKQNNTSRPNLPRCTSSRDKDMQFTICQSDGSQSREKDHRETKNNERIRERELPLVASQTAARDRAIQQKRREIDEVYYQECEMFGLVAKMLIAKDPSLERPIQSSLQENLRDIGKRCVEAMEKFIKDYDSRELLH